MPTTIQVSRRTLELLKRIKEREQTRTYDELILKLIGKVQRPTKSMFGKYPKLKPFLREEIDRIY